MVALPSTFVARVSTEDRVLPPGSFDWSEELSAQRFRIDMSGLMQSVTFLLFSAGYSRRNLVFYPMRRQRKQQLACNAVQTASEGWNCGHNLADLHSHAGDNCDELALRTAADVSACTGTCTAPRVKG